MGEIEGKPPADWVNEMSRRLKRVEDTCKVFHTHLEVERKVSVALEIIKCTAPYAASMMGGGAFAVLDATEARKAALKVLTEFLTGKGT